MRRYEMMIILDPTLEEQTVQPSLDQFLSVVSTGGGSVDKIDVWGRRRLAYEIEKKSDAAHQDPAARAALTAAKLSAASLILASRTIGRDGRGT